MSASDHPGSFGDRPLLPDHVTVPDALGTPRFRLRPIGPQDAQRDLEAVVESADRLEGMFACSGHPVTRSWAEWPRGLDLATNTEELRCHAREFAERVAFTYTVTSPDGGRTLGCVYVLPAGGGGADAEVFVWVRTAECGTGLEDELVRAVRGWIATRWPFGAVRFPGRDGAAGDGGGAGRSTGP